MTQRRMSATVMVLSALALAGCASRSVAPNAPVIDRERERAYEISAAEIDERNEATVGELVKRLRPLWGRWGEVTFLCAVDPCSNFGGSSPTAALIRLEYVRAGTPIPRHPGISEGGVVLMYFGDRSVVAK